MLTGNTLTSRTGAELKNRPAWNWRGLLTGVVLLAAAGRAPAQALVTLQNQVVQVSTEVQSAPPAIKLVWPADAQATDYDVYRNLKGQGAFTSVSLAGLPGSATQFVDNSALPGSTYEYRVRKTSNGHYGVGFVVAGMEAPAIESRGTLVLVVASTHAAYLAADIARLRQDLVGDGWRVLRHDVAPTMPAPQVKALIQARYQAAPTQVRAVLLLGHVAVPYSGDFAPDAHPDHVGAWPADVYYADMNGVWTDATVNRTSASRAANRNVPGDGKFDQSALPSDVELQVGRIDLANMPAFGVPERDLLRRYLRKNHEYRHKVFTVSQRGLVDDNFGTRGGEQLANNGWRNFSALLGASNVVAADYLSTLRSQSYAWAYACGNGFYSSLGGVGGTSHFAAAPVRGVFSMLFGSYFGDWDTDNNLLRAPLAAEGHGLTSCWAGRPEWFMYHMGMGEPIGYSTRLSQNTSGFYYGGFSGRGVHIALMGDPTLRQHVVAPPAALSATAAPDQATLTWTASPDAGAGYYVYRATTPAGPFSRITPQPVVGTTFVDPAPLPGAATYQVRARQLTTSPSGSYYNLSQGIFVNFTPVVPVAVNATWLGGQSGNWNTPANWSTNAVPTQYDVATIAPARPFAPILTAATTVNTLVLLPQAQLTLAAGAALRVRTTPQLQPAAAGLPPTRLLLAAGPAPGGGGRLLLPDHSTAQAGLQLPAGTALTVGNYAEVHLMGHFTTTGAAIDFSPWGRLTFANDPAATTLGIAHSLTAAAPVAVGVLALEGASESLVLNGPVQVLNQVLNPGVIVTNNQLTLRSGPGQQGRLQPVVPAPGQPLTLGVYTGNVRVEVYVDGSRNPGPGYRHLAAPVGGATIGSLATGGFAPVVNPLFNTQGASASPFPNVFLYNQTRIGQAGVPGPVGFNQGWLSPGGLTDALSPAVGYTVHLPGSTTLSFNGPAFTAASILRNTLRRGPHIRAGWHLLGNPYAAPLNWDLVTASSTAYPTSMEKALYIFKSSGPYAGTYASYIPAANTTPGAGVNGGTPVVPVGQAFFVRTDARAANGFVRLGLSAVLTTPDATSVQRPLADTRPRLVLALRNVAGTQAHQTAIYFQAGATPDADADYDALFLAGPAQALTLSSASSGTAFSINGLPALAGADVAVPLHLGAAAAGTYQLATETLANLPAGYHAYFVDAATGRYTNLAATPVISVQLPAGAPVAGRYQVVLTTQTRVLATTPAALAALVSLYPNPAHDQAALVLPLALRNPQTTVTLLSSLGQAVAEYHFGPTAPAVLAVPLTGLAPGLYTVRVHTTAGTISRRLVVE